MLTEIRNLLSEIKRKADLARDLGLNESVVELSDAISADEVQRLADEFEKHATAYDGGYADRLSAAIAAAVPVA